MEVDIDPLQVLEQIIMTNEENSNHAEVPEDEYLESINSLAAQFSQPATDLEEGNQDSSGPSKESEMAVDPVASNAKSSSPIENAVNAPSSDPLSVNNEEVVNSRDIDPLPSAPDFSFMDLLSAPVHNPLLVLETPPLIAFNQNNNFEEVRMKQSRRGGARRQNARKSIVIAQQEEEKKKFEMVQRSKLMANINQLASVSQREQAYRHKLFPDEGIVRRKQLDCTICGSHIGCRPGMSVICVTHPLLKVLVCTRCKSNYMQADWKLGVEGKDLKCRWCSKPPNRNCLLKNCSQCPFAFCQNCISRNFSKAEWELTISKAYWTCYACQMIPFYLSRAICWALGRHINTLLPKKGEKPPYSDLSICCSVNRNTAGPDRNGPTKPKPTIITPGRNGAMEQMHFDWVRKRLNTYFSQLQGMQNQLLARMGKQVITHEEKGSAVHNIVEMLTSISALTTSASSAVCNWLRLQKPDPIPTDERVTVLSSAPAGSVAHQRPAQKRSAVSNRRQPAKRARSQTPLNYDELVKKFNIRPCYVLLERYTGFEEVEQPDLTHLLFPKVELRVDVDESLNDGGLSDDCIVLD